MRIEEIVPNRIRNQRLIKLHSARGLDKSKTKLAVERWSEKWYSADSEELLSHLATGSNYGVICGSGLVVIDTDNEEAEKQCKSLPETFTIQTAKGYHRYYYCPEWTQTVHDEGLDIQSNGSYVVGPGSLHENGDLYRVTKDMQITRINKNDIGKLCLGNNKINYNNNNNYNYIQPELISESVSDSNSENIDIYSEDSFKENNYSLKEGISFIEFHDLLKFTKHQYWYNGNLKISYKTKGSVHFSPKFVDYDIDILLSQRAVKELRKLGKRKNGYFIFYKSTSRIIAVVECNENNFFDMIGPYSDEEIISKFPEFVTARNSKLNNMKRNPITFQNRINRLREGDFYVHWTDKDMIAVMDMAVKMDYSDKDLHQLYKNYFKERYDKEETDSQIRYARKKAEA